MNVFYDDTELQEKIDELKKRIVRLEELQRVPIGGDYWLWPTSVMVKDVVIKILEYLGLEVEQVPEDVELVKVEQEDD